MRSNCSSPCPRHRAPRPGAGGQSASEYAILLGVITVFVLGIQAYAKRGIQAGVRMAADQIGAQQDGLADIDLSLIWITKGSAEIATKTDAATTVKTERGGSVSVTSDERATSTGILSENLFADPNQ